MNQRFPSLSILGPSLGHPLLLVTTALVLAASTAA